MSSSCVPTVRAKVLLLAILFCLLFPQSLLAIDLSGDNIQLHGFLTQGYLESKENNFLGDTKDGTFRLTEIGLNINAHLTEKFRLGGQALYCQLPAGNKGKVRADWLVAEYHFADPFGVRLGKVKMPMGLYNMERDSDFLRPLIFLPQSIYDETRRDSWQAHWGGEIYGNLLLSHWGDIDYQLFGGRIQYDDDSLATLAASEIVNRYNQQNSLHLSTEDLSRQNNYVYGAALFFNPALKGLRSALTFLALDDESWLHENQVSSLHVRSKLVASLEYSWQQFSMTTEYSETDRRQEQFNVTTLDGPSQSWYLLLSYSPIEALTFSLLYDEYYRLKNNRHEPVGPNNLYPWRKDLAASLRYDITENWTAKAEWHAIDGTAFYMGYFNPHGAERYWQYGALKLSFNF
ncbi:MAG: hypothetical protein KKD01_01915 [Proteobacteria bacterium]|nr:hypothetical protein [Pseudomonadota bacterium]MBU1419664.1 hypothetical protein [Pseudomonadota bacterium]MBU1453455.1 hypothetical protein [Pseudomonadota bacterium]